MDTSKHRLNRFSFNQLNNIQWRIRIFYIKLRENEKLLIIHLVMIYSKDHNVIHVRIKVNHQWNIIYMFRPLLQTIFFFFCNADCHHDDIVIPEEATESTSRRKRSIASSLATNSAYTMEVLVAVDKKMKDYHGDNLNAYVLTLMSIVSYQSHCCIHSLIHIS